MSKQPVPLEKATRLINPSPLVLVCAGPPQEANLLPIAWVTPLQKSPPLVGVLCGTRHHSYPLIQQGRCFTVNVVHEPLLERAVACGRISGNHTNKFQKFDLTPTPATHISSVFLGEAPGHLECILEQEVKLSGSFLVGRIVAAAVEPQLWDFDENVWNLNKIRLAHHLGGKHFELSGTTLLF